MNRINDASNFAGVNTKALSYFVVVSSLALAACDANGPAPLGETPQKSDGVDDEDNEGDSVLIAAAVEAVDQLSWMEDVDVDRTNIVAFEQDENVMRVNVDDKYVVVVETDLVTDPDTGENKSIVRLLGIQEITSDEGTTLLDAGETPIEFVSPECMERIEGFFKEFARTGGIESTLTYPILPYTELNYERYLATGSEEAPTEYIRAYVDEKRLDGKTITVRVAARNTNCAILGFSFLDGLDLSEVPAPTTFE